VFDLSKHFIKQRYAIRRFENSRNVEVSRPVLKSVNVLNEAKRLNSLNLLNGPIPYERSDAVEPLERIARRGICKAIAGIYIRTN